METIDKCLPEFSKLMLFEKNMNFDTAFAVITENSIQSNASAFIATLLPFYLKSNYKVVFIACNEALIHYTSISRRLGSNLVNNPLLYYIDAFYSPYKKDIAEELPLSEHFPPTFNCIKTKNYFLCTNHDNLSDLVAKVLTDNGLTGTSDSKTVVIIDNIAALPYTSKLSGLVNQIGNCCVSLNANFIVGLNTSLLEEDSFDYKLISHLADIEFEFLPNESGFSKDIDGKVKITLNSLMSTSVVNLIYKIKENGFEFMQHFIV